MEDFDDIFEAYYALYRAEEDTPASSDAEYTIALRLANEAINRWENYDGVKWQPLYSTHQTENTGTQTISTGVKTYTAATNMRSAGGFVRVNDADGNMVQRYPIIEPQEAQFRDDNSNYAYFTGNPNNGFTLHINPAPPASLNGLDIDYVLYKKATRFTTGTDKTQVPDLYYIVHRMLANRFRISRNPYYNTALRDAENALRQMKMDNDAGTWANPWKLADNSGSSWGS